MVVRLKVKVITTQAIRSLERIRKAVPLQAQKALDAHGRWTVAKVRELRFSPYPGFANENPRRTTLYRRTGKLKGSIKSRRLGNDKIGVVLSAGEGIGDDRADLQELGGTVFGAPWVDIPLEGVLTPTGRIGARFPNADVALRDKNVFQVNAKNGRGKVVLERIGKGKVQLLFARKHSIQIPGPRTGGQSRFKFRDTIRKTQEIKDHRMDAMRNAIKNAIQAGRGTR